MTSIEPEPQNIIKDSDAGPALVARAFKAPGSCIVTGDIDGPFVETQTDIDTGRIYLHAPWVEQVARDLLDMVPRSEIEALEAKVTELQARVENWHRLGESIEGKEKAEAELEAVVA